MDNKKVNLSETDIYNNENLQIFSQLSNPLGKSDKLNSSVLGDYTRTVKRTGYDRDIAEIAEAIRVLNNMAPLKMPEYDFNIEHIRGERYYKPDGSLLFIRNADSDSIKDHYYNPESKDKDYSVSKILEHDKKTGRLKVKIEPIIKNGSKINTSIAIFDAEVSNRYTIIQLSEKGIVSSISEFSGKGKSFRTLFRSVQTFRPARYIEGNDNKESGFEMIDCLLNSIGSVVRIKHFSNKKEVNIQYTPTQKYISVKTKE